MRLAVATVAVAAFVLCSPTIAAPAVKDWTMVATMAPSGGIIMGNPRAKVKLIEYASFTCPHCAHFSNVAMASLRKNYIRTGRVSLEARNAIRDRVDLAATLLARCGGPSRYFATSELIFAKQEQWAAVAGAFEQAQSDQLSGKPQPEVLAAVASGAGFDTLLRSRGLTPVRAKACLADKVESARVAAMADEAWNQRGISGTPFFLVNGVAVNAVGWPAVEAALRTALR